MNKDPAPQPGARDEAASAPERQMEAQVVARAPERRRPYAPAFGTGSGGFVFRDYASI